MDKEDIWALKLSLYTFLYLAYILMEGRDDTVDIPIAIGATILWAFGMLKTLHEEYQRSI